MKPFVFHNPTKIVFGEGVISQTGAQVKETGLRRVLWMYGQASIKKAGIYDIIAKSLREAGVAWVEFPGVRPNPVLSHAREGIALARREKVDGILAVGGGSVIDEAKGIAAGVPAKCDVWDFYEARAAVTGALPIVAVQTLPATGTEMNGGTVLTHDETREKLAFISPAVNPRVSLLDPEVTYALPRKQTAYGATDAMSHLMESYFTHREPWLPIQDGYAEAVLKAIMESMERILREPRDAQARATLMWATTLAWNGMASAGAGPWGVPNHMLEHPMSGLFDVPHGAGLAVVIPAWMAWESRRRAERIARFARQVMGVADSDDAAAAAAGAKALRAWFTKIGCPATFGESGVPAAALPQLVEHASKLCQRWGLADYTPAQLEEIYRSCL